MTPAASRRPSTSTFSRVSTANSVATSSPTTSSTTLSTTSSTAASRCTSSARSNRRCVSAVTSSISKKANPSTPNARISTQSRNSPSWHVNPGSSKSVFGPTLTNTTPNKTKQQNQNKKLSRGGGAGIPGRRR